MDFLFAYLKQNRRTLAAFFVFSCIFGLSFFLYHLPVVAVLYPALLCGLIGVIWACWDIRRSWRRHLLMEHLKRQAGSLPSEFPPTNHTEVRDYQQLVALLCEMQTQQETLLSRRYQDMVDYYTLWAHQIKTPIAAMRLQLQNEDTSLSRALSTELTRIEQYAEMVLAYLRLDSASTDYVFRECDLDAILRACIRRFSGEFIARRLKLSYTPTNHRLVTDEKWLGFVIEQLLSNALKYTPSGSIFLYLEPPGTLCIRDTGIGIAPEDLPRIFENGFTGLNGRTDRKSSGLGLHLCKRICSRLGHDISIESALDSGTLVRINLAQDRLNVE